MLYAANAPVLLKHLPSDINPPANATCCGKYRCTCEGPFALYRKRADVSVFTGIVTRDKQSFLKLDDPKGQLDGQGHVMEHVEFAATMSCFDDSSLPSAKHVVGLVRMSALTDDKLMGFDPTARGEECDVAFPWKMFQQGTSVRHGDRVKGQARRAQHRRARVRARWRHTFAVCASERTCAPSSPTARSSSTRKPSSNTSRTATRGRGHAILRPRGARRRRAPRQALEAGGAHQSLAPAPCLHIAAR